MDKSTCDKSLHKKSLISQPRKNNLQYETPQATENNENNIIDYRNISLSLTGEISSPFIHRNNLTQTQPNISFVEDTEDDDEQFISHMKEIIDKNYKTQNKENYSIRDLQSQSYLSRKKKCVFSDEDQNLIKRFKKSVSQNKMSCTIPQKVQQSETITSVSNSQCAMITSPKVTSASTVTLNRNDTEFNKCSTNQFLSYVTKQKNDNELITPKNIEYVTETKIVETEIDQLVYCEMYYLTPPKNESLS